MDRKTRIRKLVITILLALLWTALGGCVRSRSVGADLGSGFPFLPPTIVPTAASTSTSAPAAGEPEKSATPAAAGACIDSLVFIADATIPDGTEVQAGSTIDKRWEVRNNGTCNWDERYHLRLIAGPEMGVEKEQALFPARSGSSAVIRILFTAPAESGKFRSAWQAVNPDNQPFGDPIYIEVVVK